MEEVKFTNMGIISSFEPINSKIKPNIFKSHREKSWCVIISISICICNGQCMAQEQKGHQLPNKTSELKTKSYLRGI